jgi:hypothetical protein
LTGVDHQAFTIVSNVFNAEMLREDVVAKSGGDKLELGSTSSS